MWPAQCTMGNRMHMFRVTKGFKYLMFLACLYFTAGSEITVITEGQTFLLAFPENLPNDCQFALNLTSTMTSALILKQIQANISVPALNASKVLTMQTGTGVGISLRENGLSPDATSNVSRNNIIHVNVAGGKISVYGRIMCDSASLSHRKFGEFLAIPVEFWGTRHVVMSPSKITCGYTVTVLAGASETKVTLDLKITSSKPNGYVHIGSKRMKGNASLKLEPYTRTEICAVNTDITGTTVDSDFPIGLLVGPNNEASFNAAFCDVDQGLFIEQLIPTYAWGKKYYLIGGGVSSSVGYTHDIRVVTSTASTTIYYDYLTSFENLTLRFKNSQTLRSAGDIYKFSLSDRFGFEMIAANLPVMVVVHTYPTNGGDGALSQAVQARFFPERIVLRFDHGLGQRMYLFTDTACSVDLNSQMMTAFNVNAAYTALDYRKLGAGFYVNSSTNGALDFLATLSVNTDIEGCSGISASIMSDITDDYDVLAACPVFWNVECSDGQYFDLGKKECLSIQTTTLDDITDEPQLSTVATSNAEHTSTIEQITGSSSDAYTVEDTLLNNKSTAKTVGVSNTTLYSGHSTVAVVTSQTSTNRNEPTGYDLFDSNLMDSTSAKMTSNITYSPIEASTSPAASSHLSRLQRNPNVTLNPLERNDTESELNKYSASIQSYEPFISFTEATRPSTDSWHDADDAAKSAASHCPCMCQSRANRTYQYQIFAADMLKVNAGNLSRHRRSRNSAIDWRPLSVSFGVGGMVVFACTVVFALLPSVVKRKQSREWKPS